jgi:hypothetical protein
MPSKQVKSPLTNAVYTIRKLPLIYLSRFRSLQARSGGEEITLDVWRDVVELLKASVVEPKISSEEDVINLGEDADWLLQEVVAYNQPSEALQSLFRAKGAAQSGGVSGGALRGEA